MSKLRNSALSSAWATWRSETQLKQQKAEQLARAVACFRKSAMKAAFAGWRAACLDRMAAAEKLANAFVFLRNRLLGAAWNSWMEVWSPLVTVPRISRNREVLHTIL